MTTKPAVAGRHWLAAALDRVLPESGALDDLSSSLPVEEAWSRVCSTLDWSPDRVAHALAERFRLARADLSARDPQAAALLPESVARDRGLVVLRHTDRTLVVATINPVDADAEQEVAFLSGRTTEFEVATPEEIREALRTPEAETDALESVLGDLSDAGILDSVRVVEARETDEVSERELRTAPVIRLTNLILQRAVAAGATDIHLEPERDGGRVRLRIDGVLHPFLTLPLPALIRVVSRIKILAELDIADRIRPQDGRMRVEIAGRPLDLRISTIPVRSSEKVVVRILDPSATFDMQGLGLDEGDREGLGDLLAHRTGIVLVTGPTGSGKTTTLYAALATLSSAELNISTVEQPVEYELRGISQIQVEPRKGVTFASALRALLRQDPDVILVGEIRDTETAEIAAHASMTGHQVLSTLHTNDAVGAVDRLRELELDDSTIASCLRGVVAQRLVRRLCPECVRPVESRWDLPEAERSRADELGVTPLKWAPGCEHCGQSGYRGRAPVVEILPVDGAMVRGIAAGEPGAVLRDRLAREGHRDLWHAGLELVRRGVTSLVEIERVLGTHTEGEDAPAESGRAGAAPEPLAATAAAPTPGSDMPSPASPLAMAGTGEAPGPEAVRVLVVEDDTGTRTLIRAALGKAGFDVVEAEDGEEALNILGRPDHGVGLVTLDLNMPRLGGLEVLEVLRGDDRLRSLPVVVATHSDDEASELALLSAGADDYLVKPVNPARLISRLQAVLRRQAFRAA